MVGGQRDGRRATGSALVKAGLVAAVVVALVAGVISARGSSPSPSPPLAVRSSGPTYRTLAELVRASDVVVDGVVTAVAPGRLFSDAGGAGIRSQLVTVQVSATLSGHVEGDELTVEEEATTGDRRPVVIDGLRPSRVGDGGVFFLAANPDPATPYFATTATTGRFLYDAPSGDVLRWATDAGALARRLAALGRHELTASVRRTSGGP